MAVNPISAATKEAIERKTAKYMPDRPSESGLNAETIRARLYKALTDSTVSFYAEINRIVAEVNAEITAVANEFLVSSPTLPESPRVGEIHLLESE